VGTDKEARPPTLRFFSESLPPQFPQEHLPRCGTERAYERYTGIQGEILLSALLESQQERLGRYRRYAEDAWRQTRSTADLAHRRAYVRIAENWTKIADWLEAEIERQKPKR
jgi:hypothetical protein